MFCPFGQVQSSWTSQVHSLSGALTSLPSEVQEMAAPTLRMPSQSAFEVLIGHGAMVSLGP